MSAEVEMPVMIVATEEKKPVETPQPEETKVVCETKVGDVERPKEEKPNLCKKLCKRWFIDAFGGMALGLFCTLIAGLIIKQIAQLFGTSTLAKVLTAVGQIASVLMGCGIGAGIGLALGAPRLVVFCSIVNGFIGANASALVKGTLFVDGKIILGGPGDPISAYLASIVAVEIGILIAGKTSIDILIVPLISLILGSTVAYFLGPPVASVLASVGFIIEKATALQPVLMGMLVAVIMGVLLTLPTSSTAIGISIGLSGISAAAASAGCACQMVGFAVSSYRENGFGGLIAQGVGTSMLQIPNIMKHPLIFIPPIIASLISGPISSALFKLNCNAAGSGMGTSGFVGVLMTYDMSVGILGVGKTVLGLIVCFFVIPVVVSLLVSEIMRKKGWIKEGDMKIMSN